MIYAGLRIGYTGYFSLRRDQLAPIASVDKYYGALWHLYQQTGNFVTWMPLKELSPDCRNPGPDAEADEIFIHQKVIHYGDALWPMMRYCNDSPTEGRWQWLRDHPFDFSTLQFELPELDVVIVEGTSQIGSAYGLDCLLQALYAKNSQIGFIIIDQDVAGSSVRGKIRRWHPSADERIVMASYHQNLMWPNQISLIVPYMPHRELPPLTENNEIVYVGNDYKRREPMLRLFAGPQFHLYGRIKDDFKQELLTTGIVWHGPFTPTERFPLEAVYRRHGIGINFAREGYYKKNLLTQRLGEIVRSGVVCLNDLHMQITGPLIAPWCHVYTADEALKKAEALCASKQQWQDLILYQQARARHYLGPERYSEALLRAAAKLHEGPLTEDWIFNPYDDLLEAAGLAPWGNYGNL